LKTDYDHLNKILNKELTYTLMPTVWGLV